MGYLERFFNNAALAQLLYSEYIALLRTGNVGGALIYRASRHVELMV